MRGAVSELERSWEGTTALFSQNIFSNFLSLNARRREMRRKDNASKICLFTFKLFLIKKKWVSQNLSFDYFEELVPSFTLSFIYLIHIYFNTNYRLIFCWNFSLLNDTPIAKSTPNAQIRLLIPFPNKRHQGSLEKWLIPELGENMRWAQSISLCQEARERSEEDGEEGGVCQRAQEPAWESPMARTGTTWAVKQVTAVQGYNLSVRWVSAIHTDVNK